MKALFKKSLAVLLSVLLLFTAVPFTASTATLDEAEQSVGASNGTTGDCTWTLDDYGTLTISGNGAMEDYLVFNNSTPWGTNIKTVIIEDGVTSIGVWAFSNCTGLTSVTIGNSVTSIGRLAFYDCKSLTSVMIPDGVTSINDEAFYCCFGLTNVTIGNGVTSIGVDAFIGCTGLTSVTIPDSVTSIGNGAFYGCTSLTSVTIPDSVTSIGNEAFSDTAWYNNQSDGLIYAGKVAYKYKGTMPDNTSVILQDGTKGIAGSAFFGCTGMTTVTIPDSLTTIGSGAFSGCTNLTSVTIPDSVKSIGDWAFSGATGMTSVTIPDSVTSIGSYAFSGCTGMTSVTIGNSVKSIGNWAFTSCTGMTSVIIGNSVTSIGGEAFYGCTGLTSVIIPDSVKSIGGYAFYCTGLTSVTIGNGVTSIGEWAFYGCIGLTDVIIPDSVTSIGVDAFYGCPVLTAGSTGECIWILSADGVLTIRGKGEMGNFKLRDNIKTVVIEDGVTGIGDNAFDSCTDLTSVTIPDSVTSIGIAAFYGCAGLTSVTIPDSVTSIGDYAFSDCTGLASVKIPDSVTSIGVYALGYYFNNGYGYKKIDGFTIYGSTGSEAERYANDNGFIFKELSSEEPTYQPTECPTEAPTDSPTPTGLNVHATSNFFPAAKTYYPDLSMIEDENGDIFITVEYKMAAVGKYLVNLDVDQLTWDKNVLEFKEAYNKIGTNHPQFTIFPFAVEQVFSTGMVNTFGDANGGRIVGNYTSIDPAAYATEEDGISPVTVVRATFKLLDRNAAETTVNLVMDTLSLEDETDPDSGTKLAVFNRVINEDAYALGTYSTFIIPDGAPEAPTEPPTEASTEPVEDDILIVAGSEAEIFGTGWDGTNEANLMTRQADGTYTKKYTVNKAYESVLLKTVKNGAEWIGDPTGNNVIFSLTGSGTFTVVYDPVENYTYVTGDIVQYITNLEYDTVFAVGNGEGMWLNGASWDSAFAANEMTEVAEDVWEIEFTDVPDGFERQVKFAIDGAWTHNFGGDFKGSGVVTAADYNGDNITFDTEDVCTVKVQLDLRDFNIATKQGATFTVTITYNCPHINTQTIKGYPATCTEAGLTDGLQCVDCHEILTEQSVIPAKGHTVVRDNAKAPTCTEAGLTIGSHCSVCGEIFQAQEEIPALGHKPVIDQYLEPTCQHEGHTMGAHCENCGEVYVAYDIIPKLPHTAVTDEAVAPSCTQTGLTEGSHCSVCGEIIVAQKTVPTVPHTAVTDEAVAPSCTQTGLTEGSHCSVCGEVIVAQQIVPTLPHQYEIIMEVPATYTKEGATAGVRCKICGEWLLEPQVIPKKPVDFIYGDANGDGFVNVNDVTAIQIHLANIQTLTGKELGAADTNADGVVTIDDVTLLQMYLAEFHVTMG